MELVRKFQDGGAMGGQDAGAALIQGAQAALQNQDCQMAMQVCQVIVQMAGAPQEAPQEAPMDQPVYKMGGKLSRRISRK